MGYSREIYEQAEKTLELRRLYSEQELDKRRRILYGRSPRAETIERTIAGTSVAAAKAILGGSDLKRELNALKETNLQLQRELASIIKELGFPENYLEPWYKCDKCKDRGDIDGRMCSCMKSLLREISYEQLNKISPLSLSDFDSFDLEYYSKTPAAEGKKSPYTHMTGVLAFCKKYARTFTEDSRSLLFQGAPGLGKTHLSLAIAKEVIDKGYGVIYVSAPAILSKIENEHFNNKVNENNTEQLITECDLLIIDDLGTEFISRFTVSTLYNMINTRMIRSKPTIISTNLFLSELQDNYNIRTVSRIIGTLDRVEFIGTDVRQLKRRRKASADNR